MLVRPVATAVLIAGCTLLLGCARNATLAVTKSYDVAPGEAQAMILDPQPKPQKLSIDFKSSEGDVLVLVFKESDMPAGDDPQINADAKKALASKKGKAESITVEVPANTGTQIVMREAQKKTKVDLTVTNKK